MGNFSFTKFLINRAMGCCTKGASHFCFRKAVSDKCFQKVILINFISAYPNLLKNFSFAYFLLISVNRALENLCNMDDYNRTKFLTDRAMGCSTKDASHCCMRSAVVDKYFQKVMLINFISAYANLLKNFSFAHFLLISANRTLENLCNKGDYNRTNFLADRTMGYSTKGASHCCLRKAVSNNYLERSA